MEKSDANTPQNGYIDGERADESADDNQYVPEPDELTLLKEEVAKLKEEAKRNYDQYLRALADADNIRKRMQRDKEEYMKYSMLPLIKNLLPVMDDLERAIQAAGTSRDYESLSKGVEMINRRLQDIIREQDVVVIETGGQIFDPQFHQALVVEENPDLEENTILEELQKGYIMHGRIIRPSLVKVSTK
ncbi:MAG: nucleotide exchange factor GrpE [Syntrophomonadaceae bacterium]|nr:nucleotide exchange factor GrpE [Syntrophomonadaceae bacterium]